MFVNIEKLTHIELLNNIRGIIILSREHDFDYL